VHQVLFLAFLGLRPASQGAWALTFRRELGQG
jgi:hypothetical protein